VLPSGAGKSVVISGIADKLDAPVLIFQPTREILEQNATKLLAVGADPKVYSASLGTREIGAVTLATIGTARKVPELFEQFQYVLIDEAHGVDPKQGMYRDFLTALGDVRVMGLTATPYRLTTDGYGGAMLKFLTRTRPRVFSDVVAYAQIPDLIAHGYLVKPEYQIVSGFNAKELAPNTTGADYDDGSIKRYFKRSGFEERLVRVVKRLLEIGRRRVLVFTRFVEDAEALATAVPGAVALSADTPSKQRAAIVDGFRAGQIPVVANVGVLGVGFDYPELATVVLARPTLSLTVYYQQVGRLLRPHPTKPVPWVVDMVDQVRQFGPVEELWLQPGGHSGAQWEVVTRQGGTSRVLTNTYFGSVADFQRRKQARWSGAPRY